MAKSKSKKVEEQSGTDHHTDTHNDNLAAPGHVDPSLENTEDEPFSDHDAGGAEHTPIVLASFNDGELNQVIPFPLMHHRGSDFYAMSDDAFAALISVVVATFKLRDAIFSISQDETLKEEDSIMGLALNMINAIDMGYANLAQQPFLVPEEAAISNAVLGIAEYVYELEKSQCFEQIKTLHSALSTFISVYPIDLSVNLPKLSRN